MSREDPDLACRRVVEMVTDYLEGALPGAGAERLEQHLLLCDACMDYVDQHRSVMRALSQLAAGSLPEAAAADTSPGDAPPGGPPDPARASALELFRRLRKPSSEEP